MKPITGPLFWQQVARSCGAAEENSCQIALNIDVQTASSARHEPRYCYELLIRAACGFSENSTRYLNSKIGAASEIGGTYVVASNRPRVSRFAGVNITEGSFRKWLAKE